MRLAIVLGQGKLVEKAQHQGQLKIQDRSVFEMKFRLRTNRL